MNTPTPTAPETAENEFLAWANASAARAIECCTACEGIANPAAELARLREQEAIATSDRRDLIEALTKAIDENVRLRASEARLRTFVKSMQHSLAVAFRSSGRESLQQIPIMLGRVNEVLANGGAE